MRALDFGFYAPSGVVVDEAAVDRATRLLLQRGPPRRRGRVEPRRAISASPATTSSASRRSRAWPRATTSTSPWRFVAATAGRGCCDRLDFAALAQGQRASAGSVTPTSPRSSLPRSRAPAWSRYAGPMAAYDFGAEAPSEFTLEHCFAMLGSREHAVVACARRSARPDDRRHAVGRQSRDRRRISSARRSSRRSTAASCSSRTSPSIRTGSSACSTSSFTPACSSASARSCSARSPTTRSIRTTTATICRSVVAHLRDLVDVPVYTGLPFGHVRDKLTLPVGGRATLTPGDGTAQLVMRRRP